MKNLVKFYEENPSHSKNGVLVSNLNETAEVLRETVEQLLDRNEKLNIIAQKSKHLKSTSEDLRIYVRIKHIKLKFYLGIGNKKKRKK